MLMVIAYHGGGVLRLPNWLHGELGVDIFLVVSGFTLARSSNDLSWGAFLRRRLLRIFPAYWIALAAFIWLERHFFGSPFSNADIVAHVLGVHTFVVAHPEFFSSINDSFWFISLIVLLYVVFLPIRRRRHDLAVVLGVGLLLSAVVYEFYNLNESSGGIGHLAVRAPDFFIGVAAAQILGNAETELKLTPLLGAGLIAFCFVGLNYGYAPFYSFAGSALILVFLTVRSSFWRHHDGRVLLRGLSLIGIYSYEIFLFHQPIIRDFNRLFWARWFDNTDPGVGQLAVGMIAGLVITFGVSVLVHHMVGWLFNSKKSLPVLLPQTPAT